VVLVTFNGDNWINKCLDSLYKSTVDFKLVIIDNNSQDKTKLIIKNNYKNIQLIELANNIGFGTANNIGISHALNNNADFVFLLNQDVFVESNTLEELVKVSTKNPDYGIISPIHLNGAGTVLDSSFEYYICKHSSNNFISDFILNNKKKELYDIPMINAATWLIPKNTLETVGGFDPMFFMYGEDDNYCQRVQYHGLNIGITPNCLIKHDSQNNFKGELEKGSKKYYNKFSIRLKVEYANINNNKYQTFKMLRWYFLKLFFENLVTFNIKDSTINLRKIKIISETNLKESVLQNRIKGTHYL